MDISEKLIQLKKLLELQTSQKNDTGDTRINMLRELYVTYMFYKVEEINKSAKSKREIHGLLRLLLVHVDSENHTNNKEKILMINLIKIIGKKLYQLFSYYPNIWKGNNSSFFFYISDPHDDVSMIRNSFTALTQSCSVYRNIYISLLLFNSNNFETKIKTIKYILKKYILNNENINLSDDEPVKFEEYFITDFLISPKNSKEFIRVLISCFFFWIIDRLIRNDYITLLNEHKKKEDEEIMKQLSWDSFNSSEIESLDVKSAYLKNIISYTIKKNIFNYYFNLHGSNMLAKEVNKKKENSEGEDSYSYEGDEKNKKKILRKENIYYDTEKDEIIFNEIKDHYNTKFLEVLFFYVARIISNYELMYSEPKKMIFEIKKSYLPCCLIHCISILFTICCFNKALVPQSFHLMKKMKMKFDKYFDCSVILSLAQFMLFFSSENDFEQVCNLLLTRFSSEYKNDLVSISFFDFIIKNANILKERKFFFRNFFHIILKVYFYYYRNLKNDLIYLFPYLMNETNYDIILCLLLDVPYVNETKNAHTQNEVVRICNGSRSYILLTDEEIMKLQNNTNYQLLKTDIKSRSRLTVIRNNLHRYIKLYFDTLLTIEKDAWLNEVTKIVLHKLKCITTCEMISKKSIKEILKGLKNIINKKKEILLLFQSDIIYLLNKRSNIFFLISRNIFDIIGDNIRHLKIPLTKMEKYYFTLNFFFSLSEFEDLKFWISLLYAFTNIAISCYDLSTKILETYNYFLSQNTVPLILKNVAIENINIIANFSYTND